MRVDDIVKIIRQIVKPIRNKILLSIGRGILLAANDSGKIQVIQASLLADEIKDQVESMGHFGFSSNPPAGSDIIMVSVGGNRDHGIVIATESREYRFKNLGSGESVLYSKDGDYVHLKNGNVIDIKTKTLNIDAETEVNITSPTINLTASALVNITTPEIVASNKISAGDDIESTNNIKAGINVEASVQVLSPGMTASASMLVAGQELNGYETHTHDYEDDNGITQTTKTTQGVN